MTQFIDPKTLSRVKDLPLVAKTLAHGFLQGLHDSRQRGVGIEFSQYRVYEPGDELSKIDWKLFARSDRYFVREAERESEINVWFVLDCSESMLQASSPHANKSSKKSRRSTSQNSNEASEERVWSKLKYSQYLIATMAYLAQKQGDSVGLLALSSGKSQFTPAYAGERHWQKLLIELTQIQPNGTFPEVEQVKRQLSSLRKNGLIILLSDFHQQHDEISQLAINLANDRTEVISFHLSSNDEIDFPFTGAIRFEDLETKEQRLVSAEQVKDDYLTERQAYNTQLESKLTKHRVQYVPTNIDQPLNETLFTFLNARKKVIR